VSLIHCWKLMHKGEIDNDGDMKNNCRILRSMITEKEEWKLLLKPIIRSI